MTNNLSEQKLPKSKTFKITMFFTVSTEGALDQLLDMRKDILSGQTQRDLVNSEKGLDKVQVTFEEIT